MEKLDLEVQERAKIGKQLKGLRDGGAIPAIVYGKGIKSLPVQVDEKVFTKLISRLSSKNVILNLKVGSDSLPVMMHEIQKDLLSKKIIHVDFRKVMMDEAIKAKVHIVLIGEAEGVKSDGGILVHPLREIEIKALPANIPDKIEIKISDLKIGDAIHVSNLPKIEGVEYITPVQEIVVTISAPTKEEEVVAPVAAEAVPGAVPAEGAAAVPGAPGAAAPAAEAAAKPGAPAAKAGAPAAKAEKKK